MKKSGIKKSIKHKNKKLVINRQSLKKQYGKKPSLKRSLKKSGKKPSLKRSLKKSRKKRSINKHIITKKLSIIKKMEGGFDKKNTKFPRKYTKSYCLKTSCNKMGFSQKASCRYYKNCYKSKK